MRINDYDAHQYTIEKLNIYETGKNIGKETWQPIAYVGSVKSLPEIAKRLLGDYYAVLARKKSDDDFEHNEIQGLIAQLPSKTKRVKK